MLTLNFVRRSVQSCKNELQINFIAVSLLALQVLVVYMDIFLSIVLYGFYLVDKVSVVDNRASIIKHRIFF